MNTNADKDGRWRTPFYNKLKQLSRDISTFNEESRGVEIPNIHKRRGNKSVTR